MQVAFEAAKELKDKDDFQRLGQTAQLLGNLEVSEKCLQIGKQFDKLNFFYAATGQMGKLRKMQGVA
jgi:coatomer protein complex subunit alpha (xenin)